ncbi:MAG: hypothetical protein SPF51_05775 [Candidatus Fimivicinus sp.]|nr:hypothetical protein [Oscillospiraceae bacterium]MDY5591038.1 hypothetical protein [Candidatus Fimivicinus sp.]
MKIKTPGNNFKEAPAGIRKAAVHTACQTGQGAGFLLHILCRSKPDPVRGKQHAVQQG